MSLVGSVVIHKRQWCTTVRLPLRASVMVFSELPVRYSDYDQRNCETVTPAEGYSAWSESYDRGACAEMDLDLLERIEHARWDSRRRAADLGCGTGRIGAWLRGRGVAQVDGIDVTADMIELARRKNVYEQLAVGDLSSTPFSRALYDLVISVLVVEHLPSLDPLYAEAARLAVPGGALVVLGYHPHFLLNGIPTHFRRDDGRDLAIENHIHMLSAHHRTGRARGWSLCEFEERLVDAAWVARKPSYERHLGQPISFVMLWQR